MSIGFTLSIGKSDAKSVTSTLQFGDASLNGAPNAQITGMLKNMKVVEVMDHNGKMISHKDTGTPPGLPLDQMMGSFGAGSFPPKPVKPGDTWSTNTKPQGLTTYRFTGISTKDGRKVARIDIIKAGTAKAKISDAYSLIDVKTGLLIESAASTVATGEKGTGGMNMHIEIKRVP